MVAVLLEDNLERRQNAEAEMTGAKQELRRLLLRGHTAGMRVTVMAAKAQVSRDTAHRILKDALDTANLTLGTEAGAMTWPEKQKWAKEIVARIPRGDLEQNEFKAFVNMLLLKALGSNPEDVPRSVKGVIEDATKTMRTVARKPHFQPNYDPELLRVPWPEPRS